MKSYKTISRIFETRVNQNEMQYPQLDLEKKKKEKKIFKTDTNHPEVNKHIIL